MPAPDPIDLLQELIRIDSTNPDLVEGAVGEAALAEWCAELFTGHGFDVQRLEDRPGRPSIVATSHGRGGGRSLMLNGHLDTVGIASYEGDAFSGDVRDGNVYGRGAFDMKGGVAAIMAAAVRASAGELRGDVIVTLVADEEFASIGTEEVLRHCTADAAIVTEPSNLDVVMAHRGFAWFELHLTGRAAHGSMPHEGIDAIAHAGLVLRELDELRARFEREPKHPLLGHSAVRVSTIAGGSDAATVADSCTLTIERRTLPGETPDAVEAELRAVLDALAQRVPDVEYRLRRLVARGALEVDPDWPIVRALQRSARQVLGREPRHRGEPFWTDAALIADAGIPCLLIGVDGGGAHADTEWATVESVLQLTDILTLTIRDFCA